MHIVHYAVVVERHQLFSYLVDVFIHRVQVLARVLSILDMDQPVDLIFNFNLFFVEFHAVFTPIEKVIDLGVKTCLFVEERKPTKKSRRIALLVLFFTANQPDVSPSHFKIHLCRGT